MSIEFVSTLVGVTVGIMSILATFSAVSRHYRQRMREVIQTNVDNAHKAYAAERDFNHLQRNYQNLQTSVDLLNKDLDLRVERLEIRFARLETLIRVLSKNITGDSIKDMTSEDDL